MSIHQAALRRQENMVVPVGQRKPGLKSMLALMVCLLILGCQAKEAQAHFGIADFTVSASADGLITRQAGSHPDLMTALSFPFRQLPAEADVPDGRVRTVNVHLPSGLVGDPTATPTCSEAGLVAGNILGTGASAICPPPAQIGVAYVRSGTFYEAEDIGVPVYNMDPPAGVPAMFAFNYLGVVIRLEPTVRGNDFGVSTKIRSISEAQPILGTKVVLWGVPADPSHDAERWIGDSGLRQRGVPSEAAPAPFLSLPTSCSPSPLVFRAEAASWEQPDLFSSAALDADQDGFPFAIEGCDRLSFDPAVTVSTGSHLAAGPTGLEFGLAIPQNEDPDGLSTAHLRKAVVTLPQGFSLSPSAAAGLNGCSPGEIGLGSNSPPTCPGSSMIGTIGLKTPLLDQELEGNVFLAESKKNPFGSLIAMYLAIKGPGFYLKLPGEVEADPFTGQLTTTFSDTPKLPFEQLRLSLRGGPRAPLVAPATCGVYETGVELTSWASPVPVHLSTPTAISEGCSAGGFNPGFTAGTSSPIAGKFSAFNLRVTRQDGEQNLSRIEATLPEGLLAKLASVPLCGDVAAATGACPAPSQVGITTVGAGAGPNPLFVPEPGKAATGVYLAGPYKGAPYSLVVKVPAQAGPFDLGTVAVRNALDIDPVTTQVTSKSDPLPQILEGIPISYRDVRVEVNRRDFTLNPTSCDPMKVTSRLTSDGARTASPSAPFQAVSCGELGFRPKLTLKLSGSTHRSAHPKLRAVLVMQKGDANIGRAAVTLPATEFLENAHIRTVCTRVQYAADNCPKGSVYGYAKAWTPLLDKPLQGPVYLRSSNHTLPDLVASLDGQIHVDLPGRIDSPGGKIRNTFWAVPDAPVSKFVLTMQGGEKGLLVNNEELCKANPRARAEFTGQNGKRSDSRPRVKVDCGKGSRGKRRK